MFPNACSCFVAVIEALLIRIIRISEFLYGQERTFFRDAYNCCFSVSVWTDISSSRSLVCFSKYWPAMRFPSGVSSTIRARRSVDMDLREESIFNMVYRAALQDHRLRGGKDTPPVARELRGSLGTHLSLVFSGSFGGGRPRCTSSKLPTIVKRTTSKFST